MELTPEMMAAISRYSNALVRRIKSQARTLRAQLEDRASRKELIEAKQALHGIEVELTQGIFTTGLTLSNVKIEKKEIEQLT